MIEKLFADEWEKIEQFKRMKQPLSERAALDALEAQLTAPELWPHRIKVYYHRLTNYPQDTITTWLLPQLKNKLDATNGAEKAVLAGLLAHILPHYAILNAGTDDLEVPEADYNDISKWTDETFNAEIQRLYLLALADESLQQVAAHHLNILTHNISDWADTYRPSVWDVLAYDALNWLSSYDRFGGRSAFDYVFDQEVAFEALPTIVAADFGVSKFPQSRMAQAIGLLQRILKRYQLLPLSKQAEAYRQYVNFVEAHHVHHRKEALIEKCRRQAVLDYVDTEAGWQMMADLAKSLVDRNCTDSSNHTAIKEGIVLLENVSRCPYPHVQDEASNKLLEIRNSSVALDFESVSAPARPILFSVNYKNLEEVVIEVRKAPGDDAFIYFDADDKAETIYKWPVIRAVTLKLPKSDVPCDRRTEWYLDALPPGIYAASAKSVDTKKQRPPAMFQVSNLAYLINQNLGERTDIIVVNRLTGQPVANALVEQWSKREYWNKKEKPQIIKAQTDQEGIASFENRGGASRYKITYLNDVFYDNEQHFDHMYRNKEGEPFKEEFHCVTDRAIYRPGQTVYFKVYHFENSGREARALAGKRLTVKLRDAQYQEVGQIEVTTNKFGSATGSFNITPGRMTGHWHLDIAGHQKYIQVEEYKRPRFEIEFDTTNHTYTLGQTVNVTGRGRSYTGESLSGSRVTYRVTRREQFPYWRFWQTHHKQDVEIAHGQITTDNDGTFSIPVELVPDPTSPTDKKPVYYFYVYVSVTDQNGETHEKEHTIAAGTVSLLINTQWAEKINKNNPPPLRIEVKNLNNVEVPATGTLTLIPLKSPGQPLVDRLWAEPDIQLLPVNKFKALFPNIPYGKEDDPASFEPAGAPYQTAFDTSKDMSDLTTWIRTAQPGWYALRITCRDVNGQPIEKTTYHQIYNPGVKQSFTHEILWHSEPNRSYQPGTTAEIVVASGFNNSSVLVEVFRGSELLRSYRIVLNGQTIIKQPITEQDRGNLLMRLSTVQQGRFKSADITLHVPFDNKKLSVTTRTFRNRLEPGQPETWQLQISDPDARVEPTEVLALMYDAALDAFAHNNISLWPYREHIAPRSWSAQHLRFAAHYNWFSEVKLKSIHRPEYRNFLWSSYHHQYNIIMERYSVMIDGMSVRSKTQVEVNEEAAGRPGNAALAAANANVDQTPTPPKPRIDLAETVFFYPDLTTDPQGDVTINFRMKDALTRWNFKVLAHTPDYKIGTYESTVVTARTLMVQPNPPRFLRAGDRVTLMAKVVNTSESPLSGTAVLQLRALSDDTDLSQALQLKGAVQPFTVPAQAGTPVYFEFLLPPDMTDAVVWRITASAGNYSDGEENVLPVLSNRMLLSESMPISVLGQKTVTKKFTALDAVLAKKSATVHQVQLETTDNPAWYAVAALPYLAQNPHQCSEQVFARLYALTLTHRLATARPDIVTALEKWQTQHTHNPLNWNEALKQIALEDTPWLLESKKSDEKARLLHTLLVDNNIADLIKNEWDILAQRQLPDGGWPWFPGSPANTYITQHIVCGFGMLRNMGVELTKSQTGALHKAIAFLDQAMHTRYTEELKRLKELPSDQQPDYLTIHYLYMRSLFVESQLPGRYTDALNHYLHRIEKHWTELPLQLRAQTALILHRFKRSPATVKDILKSCTETATVSEDLGMYWATNKSGWHWYHYPIETQTTLIELFDEVAHDQHAVDQMRLWLLKNKQTQAWSNTKATTAAIYALMLKGSNWMTPATTPIQVTMNRAVLAAHTTEDAVLGIRRYSITPAQFEKNNNVELKNTAAHPAWGAAHVQYFDEIDQITAYTDTPLKVAKKISKRVLTPQGERIEPIAENGANLQVGDLIRVRLDISTDRAMSFVHLKDLRAAALEPVTTLSSYRYQNGLGYYESTRDAATHFYIEYLPVGRYVLEYDLRVERPGRYSSGPALLQCMYAPEFNAHSAGQTLIVK